MGGSLTYVAKDSIDFADGRHRWVLIKRFAIRSEVPDRDLLADLIAHPQYEGLIYLDGTEVTSPEFTSAVEQIGNSLIASGARMAPPTPEHGPYFLASISVDNFHPTSTATARGLIQAWIDVDPIPAHLQERIDKNIFGRLNNGALYRLDGLTSAHETPWGPFTHGDFVEVVLIDRGADELELIVATSD